MPGAPYVQIRNNYNKIGWALALLAYPGTLFKQI